MLKVSKTIQCQDYLINKAIEDGFLTFDTVLDAAELFSLTAADVDRVSEALQLRGILIYENQPDQSIVDEDMVDYSRTDYDVVFEEILNIAPSLQSFIEAIKRNPSPQYGETNRLSFQIAEGNQFARERLIRIYMRNVLKIALSMSKQYEFDLEEAISSGFFGLITAVDRYDPSGFSAFHSYASMWIQQSIQRECNPVWMDYYFPAHYKERMYRAKKIFCRIEGVSDVEMQSLKDSETLAQVAKELDTTENTVRKCLQRYVIQKRNKYSIEDIVEKAESEEDIDFPESLLISEEAVYKDIYAEDLSRIVEEILGKLTTKEQYVIRKRFGLDGRSPETLEKIGESLGVTRERVRQIEAKAVRKINNPNSKRILSGYINTEN